MILLLFGGVLETYIYREFLHNLTWYLSIFIEAIDGTESMISISNDDLSIDSISYEEEWGKWEIFLDLILILLHMRITHAEE